MATTPIPQNNSNDPQVPGNFPGTVQNPTQVPAPVNPAVDPEVSPPPNDVDPNYTPNPAPVNPASDPEVPPATTEFGGGKRFDAAPVVPATNQQVPPAQDLGSEPPIDLPQAPATSIDPQIPQPDSFPEEGIDLPQALPPADPTANNTGFDDFYGEQTYTASRTGTADAVPAASTGFDDFYGEQTYTANLTGTADARPVTPANNSQVPQAPIQNIFDLIANLFSRTPAVAPTVNPQVAQAIPVPTPKTIVPTPIPPVANPQVPAAPVVQNYFTDATPAPVAPANTGFDDYYGEQTYTTNLTGTADAVPAGNTGFDDYYGEQTYTATGTGTADATPVAPANTGFDDYYGEQTYTATGTGTADAVAPASNPSVPQSNTRIDGPVNQNTLQQANPTAANDYKSYVVDTQNKIVEQQTRELEATQGYPASENQIAAINGAAFGTATVAADIKFKDQIQAADAAQSVPVNTPPPTVAPAAAEGFGPPPNDADPNFISNPGPVNSAIDPEVPQPTAEFGGGKRFAPEAVDEFGPPPNDADPNYIPNPAPVVPATNQQVPPAQDLGSEPPIDLPQAPPSTVDPQIPSAQDLGSEPPIDLPQAPPAVSAVTNPQVPAAQDLGSEPPIDLPQAPPSSVDPQIPAAQDLGSEPPIDLPQAPPAGVDPQIPQPDSFPEEGIDLPAPVQSPTPYERFLAEENAATDAAQAAATARFNAQFDDGGNIIGSTVDPQVNQGDVTDVGEFQAEPPPIPNIDTGYKDFYGVNEVNDVGEFQAEPPPIPNIDTGYEDFYGVNEVNDVGEFQADPPAIPNIDTGYEDFYGNDEVNDVGEFQTEAKSLDNDNSGYSDFFGADAAADVGEFQTEAGTGTGESASFSNFFDGGGGGSDLFDGFFADGPTKPNPKTVISPEQEAANKAKAAKEQARQQNIINQQRKQANDGDWRVRLRLAASSNYLYNAPNPGILAPLSSSSGTSGVIFPYTPQITTAYQAKYNAYELTHSNYKGYFYQGSSVGDISINATFTAQDTQEANYLLAVIHFFRSVTKMFYGQDDSALRGAPPPLVFLQGLGEYQFNLHPCVVSNFNYTLPADVDYIRALSPNNNGTNLTDRRSLQSGVTPFINPSISRLQNAGLPQGGISTPPAPPTLGTNSPTYVPTKMDIQLTLLAIQTRSQVSNQFSLKGFANGDLIKGGFW